MSCLSKVGCLTVIVVAGAGAWWLYGGTVPSFLTRGDRITTAGSPASNAASKPVTWATMKDARMPTADAIAALESKSGPAYITLDAADLAAGHRG